MTTTPDSPSPDDVVIDPADGTTTERAPFRLGYRPELDGLRAVAVILVFIAHIGFVWPSINEKVLPGSFQGVDLFFVLSGFLLTSLLLEERKRTGGFSFRGFYRRRALRLLPALCLILVVNLAYQAQQRLPLWPTFKAYFFIVFYISNWATVFGNPFILTFTWGHMWSLAVEEQYYVIFFPLLIVLLRRARSLRTVAWVLAGGIVVTWVWRFVATSRSAPTDFTLLYVRTDVRADALLLGPLVAVLVHLGHRITPKVRLLAIPALAYLVWTLCYARVDDRWLYEWAIGPIDIAWTIVMVAVLGGGHVFARTLRLRPVVWIGKISYGLYLWHLPVYIIVFRHMRYRHLANWVPFVLAMTTTFACATFSYYVVERPFLRRKRPRGSSEPATVPATAPTPA
jgi:peptidoglycan/LPS O-acetylase OafA/YrhL